MNAALHAVARKSTCASVFAALFMSAVSYADAPAQGQVLNPDIGVNVLGLLQRGTGYSDDRAINPHNGLQLQEAEVQFAADVDPYLRATAMVGISQVGGEWEIDPEEVHAETTFIPQLTIRGGKFWLALGKHNQLHHHAFPFIDAPLMNQYLLGEEGLNEAAISVAWLAPASWFSEVIVQAYDPSNESMFGSAPGNFGGLVHLKNLFDLSEDATMELGLSGTAARNALGETGSLYAADLTFKWRPKEGGKYHALIWQSEYLYGKRVLAPPYGLSGGSSLGGLATWVQYQFAERWWVQGRAEHVGWPEGEFTNQNKQSALLGFFPSEFSGFRLQYDHLSTNGMNRDDHTVALQFNVAFGAHPAHAY